jgi:hypothetical protein
MACVDSKGSHGHDGNQIRPRRAGFARPGGTRQLSPDFTVSVYRAYRPGANRPDAPPLFPVPKDALPAFLVCADDDRSHVEATVKFYLELEANHIPRDAYLRLWRTRF